MLKQVLLASTAVLFCASASAQTQTFNSIKPEHWPRGQPWAPDFQPAQGIACAWSGTNPLPADANPISFSESGIQVAAFGPTPPDYTITGQPFICGEVTTRATFSQLYGYFQATLKMPSTPGTMGAFWMNASSGSWPPEIDIVEALGKNTTMLSVTLHTKDQSAQINKLISVPDMLKGYHTYAVDWEADYITVYFDGQQVFQNKTPSDMHQPMFMLLDTAVGPCGSWEGCPASNNILDAMLVSSVEVWTSNPHLPPPSAPASGPTVLAAATLATSATGQPETATIQPLDAAAIAAAAAEPTPEQAAADQAMQATQQRLDAYDEQISAVNDRIKALQARIAAGASQ